MTAAVRTKSPLRLGFLPLTDAAPLIVAQELGFFTRHGVTVQLSREVGWATIREKLARGELEGAATLAPMLWAMALGIGCARTNVLTGWVLSGNGTALTVSRELGEAAWDAEALRSLARERGAARPLTFGVVFRFSSHHLLLRNWLLRGGLGVDRDVRVVTVPPAQMYRNLAAGTIDGYASGEPWNSLAVRQGAGVCPDWSAAHPPTPVEKVLAVTHDFALRRADEHEAVVGALAEAARWCDETANRPALAEMLAQPAYLTVPAACLLPGLVGPFQTGRSEESVPDFHVFSGINAPTVEKGRAVQSALVAAGLVPALMAEEDLPSQLFRSDLMNEIHRSNEKIEGRS